MLNIFKKIILIFLLSDIFVLLLNENFILLSSYILLLGIFICFISLINNDFLYKLQLNEVNSNEILLTYLKIKYLILLKIKKYINNIVYLIIFEQIKIKYLLLTQVKKKNEEMNVLRELYKNKTIKNKLDILFDEAIIIESSFNVGKGLNFLLLKNNNKLMKKYYYSSNNNKVNNIFNIIK